MDPSQPDLTTSTLTPSPSLTNPLSTSIHFSTPSDLSPDLDALLDLASRGQWRSLLDRLSRSKSAHPSFLPHRRLLHSTLSVLSLFKLRRFADASRDLDALLEADPLAAFDSPLFRFESYPEFYPSRSGSFVPFALRFLHAELPERLGDRARTLDRLYSLLDLVRSKMAANPNPNYNPWQGREAFVVSAICANHFAHRELDVALALIRELLVKSPSDPVLLSRLGYVQLQIGDLVAAEALFKRVEAILEKKSDDLELQNLVGRNKALGFVVAKDFVSAVREYESCIERDPADVVAVNNKALCLMYSRDLSDAIKVLEGALERVPTAALNEILIVNLCSMYELAYVNHGDVKKSLSNWIARVAPDDFDPACTRI